MPGFLFLRTIRRKSLRMKENPAVMQVLRPTESGLPD